MKSINVFLVDKEEGVIKKFQELEHELHEVSGIQIIGKATNEEEGKRQLQTLEEIQVFLIDETLDRSFLSYCRKNFPYARFLYLTKKLDRERVLPVGVSDVLFKPFTLNAFVQKITEVLQEKNTNVEEIDGQYKAISDGTRRKILDLLQENTLTAGEIAEVCQMTKPNISQHLNVLKKSGLIQEEKKGLYVYYTLKDYHLLKTNKEVHGLISIRDKILGEVQKISGEKKCESIVAAIDSQDDGMISIMKGNVTVVTLHFSFRLSSFLVEIETPSGKEEIKIPYQDSEKLTQFFGTVRTMIEVFENEYREREKEKDSMKEKIKRALQENYPHRSLIYTTRKEAKTKLKDDILSLMDQFDMEFPKAIKEEFLQDLLLEHTLLGKLTPFYEEVSVAEIMVNAPDDVWIEQKGKLKKTDITFQNEEEIYELARRIASFLGRRLDQTNPVIAARLPDGSRIHIVLPPIARKGVSVTIRKMFSETLTMNNLVDFGTLSKEMVTFLQMAVESGANIILSGGTGAGKTTMLHNLGTFIPDDERVVVVEDATELKLQHPHVVELETRFANQEGIGGIDMTNLIKTAKLMRPERILVGELRDPSMYQFLEACKNGYHGNMATVVCGNKEAIFERIFNLVLYAGFEYSDSYIKQMMGETIDLVVHIDRLKDGSRKVTEILEVIGYNDKTNQMETKKLFVWEFEGEKDGRMNGAHYFTGYQLSPKLQQKFERKGFGRLGFDDQNIKRKEQKQLIQKQLPEFVLSLAEALKAGYTFYQALAFISEEGIEPLASEIKRWIQELNMGKTIEHVLSGAKDRIDLAEFSLVANTLIIKAKYEEKSESSIRTVCTLLEERDNVYRTLPEYRKEIVLKSLHWELIEFLDLLQIAARSSVNLQAAMAETCLYVENTFSKEISTVLKEVECGKKMRESLRDMAKRLNKPEVDLVVSQLNQAEVFGTNVENVIEQQARKLKKILTIFPY